MRDFKNQISAKQAEAMLALAAKKLGKTPEQLRQQAAGGDLRALTSSMSAEQQKQVSSLLNDPAALRSFLQSDQVKELLGRFSGGK